MISALIRRSLRSPLAFAVVGSATSITAYAVAPMKCEPKEKLVGMRCNYWAGRGLMEVPRFCLAIAGKEYEDWRLQGDYDATKGMGHALDANLGRLPTMDCVDGTIGQSAAINFYIASECGLMGSSTFEAAKIIEFGEHLKELHMAFRKLVPYGSEPKAEALANFFDSEVATDYEGPADQSKSSGRQLKWYLYRMEKLVGDDGFAVGGKLSLADVQLYNTFADKLGDLSEPFTSSRVPTPPSTSAPRSRPASPRSPTMRTSRSGSRSAPSSSTNFRTQAKRAVGATCVVLRDSSYSQLNPPRRAASLLDLVRWPCSGRVARWQNCAAV